MKVPDFKKILAFPQGFRLNFGKKASQLHKDQIKTLKRPTGSAFKKLSPKYASFKQKKVGNSRPDLRLSGLMLDDFGFIKEKAHPKFGFTVEYGIMKNKSYPGKSKTTGEIMNYHLEGTDTMPPRPISESSRSIYKKMEPGLVKEFAKQIAINMSKTLNLPAQIVRI
tara:strand:- start:58 stop:558 length:501 start_codon:yes stop_codon:yes gene_type:complete